MSSAEGTSHCPVGNEEDLDILEVIKHPLCNVISQLPQGLMVAAIHRELWEDDTNNVVDEQIKDTKDACHSIGSGTISSWAYGGNAHSVFPLHHEDAWMPSANLLVAGQAKVWIFIRDDHLPRFFALITGVWPVRATETYSPLSL